MTETELAALCAAITPPDEAARAAAHAHWASLAKPLGGLGRLETTIEDAAALTGSAKLDISRRAVLVLCADNGVVAQGVSQTDSSVTRAVAENLAARRTSVCQIQCTGKAQQIIQPFFMRIHAAMRGNLFHAPVDVLQRARFHICCFHGDNAGDGEVAL